MATTTVKRAHDTADELFVRYEQVFGDDATTYAGHVHRIIGLVALQTEVPDDVATALGLAAFFHDAGIWFDGTWDYLPPSTRRATEELGADSQHHAPLVAALIDEHHRLRPARHDDPMVEAFRRADLTDVTNGLVGSPGVPRRAYRELVGEYPCNGFRPMLARAFVGGLREAPLHPMPMMKF
jgi:hypothetical protein